MRISGIAIPEDKRVDISLTYIYGIGRSNVYDLLRKAQVDAAKRVKDLTEEEQKKLLDAVSELKVEGDLRAEVNSNVKRLRENGSYRGLRHIRNLPSRGQRTRSNGRTKRGKRVTIGAIKKELATKMEASAAKKEAPAAGKK